jgi:hypothetical protein
MSRLNVSNLFNENEDGAPVVSGISTFSSPYYFVPPSGTTAQRPQNPGDGMIRFNTDSGHLEYYSGELWVDVIVNNQDLGDQNNTNSSGGTGTRGLFAGGFSPSPLGGHNIIQYITISTLGNAQDFGDLTEDMAGQGSVASRTRGVVAGGGIEPTYTGTNVIQFVTISSTGDATDYGDLVTKTRNQGSMGDQTRGIFAGGYNPTYHNVIQYLTIASTGNSVDFGDTVIAKQFLNSGQVNSAVRGIFAGGYTNSPAATRFNTIEYVTISTTGNSQDFGDLTVARHRASSICNSIRGIYAGGNTGGSPEFRSNVIDFITIASTGNAQDFGDMLAVTHLADGGCSSSTRGVIGGGYAPTLVNTMQSIEILSTGNSIDFGDLTIVNSSGTAFSNGHGGL